MSEPSQLPKPLQIEIPQADLTTICTALEVCQKLAKGDPAPTPADTQWRHDLEKALKVVRGELAISRR